MSNKKWLMPEEKAKRIAVAAIVAGVLMVLFLIAVLIVQFVKIGVANSERARLQAEIERYEQLVEQQREDLEYYESELGMYHQALEQGWSTPRS